VRGFVAIAVGAVLLIIAAAGFIIVPEHKPYVTYGDPAHPKVNCESGPPAPEPPGVVVGGFWSRGCQTYHHFPSHTEYDALRIATWAALILGVLVAATGLIRTARARPGVT
jgi:hypothetical protein